jgi:hypothetical protein
MYIVSREIMYAPTPSTPIQVFVFLFILSGILWYDYWRWRLHVIWKNKYLCNMDSTIQ